MLTLNSAAYRWPGVNVRVINLSTPGGLVDEGWTIATIVGVNGYNTGIFPGTTCASACSLIFFVGNIKMIGAGARIGVHRASLIISGTETPGTLDTTRFMAERLRSLGAPLSVVTKLLSTPPGGIAWLTHSDLATVRSIKFGPPPKSALSEDYERGWHEGIAGSVCPEDTSDFASGCRAGAASVGHIQ
jgi:hypothetical protein